MKIAFLLPVNGITGGNYVVYHHAKCMSSRGHDITIVFVSGSLGIVIDSIHGCNLKTTTLDEVVSKGVSFDVIIATWWETYYEMFHVDASCYMYFCQSDERRFYPSRMNYEVPFVEHTYLSKKAGMITMAKWIVDWLRREFDVHAEYVPNGIDLSLFNPDVAPVVPKGERVRVLIEGPGGQFFKRVDAAFGVTKRLSNIEVWYVSSDGCVRPEWKFDRMFSKLKLNEMPSVYASCDILLKLSSVESFSYPPLEMMACGGTAVVTKFTGHEEYLEHEKNVLLVEVDDDEGAYAALKRVVDDSDLRIRLSRGGMQTAKKREWSDANSPFLEAIESYMQRNSRISKEEKNFTAIINALRKGSEHRAVSWVGEKSLKRKIVDKIKNILIVINDY